MKRQPAKGPKKEAAHASSPQPLRTYACVRGCDGGGAWWLVAAMKKAPGLQLWAVD